MKEEIIAMKIVEPDESDDVGAVLHRNPKPPPTRVFNFRKHWHLVLPHLKNSGLMETLESAMNDYIRTERQECVEKGWNVGLERWKEPYDPELGPWFYTRSDYWEQQAVHQMNEAIALGQFKCEWEDYDDPSDEELERYNQFESQFFPREQTVEWYQLVHGCFWMAPWLQQLGGLMFPDLCWKVAEGDKHAFAYATDGQGNIVWIFDILLFEHKTATQLIKFVNEEFTEEEIAGR